MRRPHVYQHSVPRARREAGHKSSADHSSVARSVLPAFLAEPEACGAVALARYLGQALSEAEGIVVRI